MQRRRALKTAGIIGLSALAGCTESLSSTSETGPEDGSPSGSSTAETSSDGPPTPIADADPWKGTVISLRDAEPTEIRAIYDDVPRILTGAAQTAFVANDDASNVRKAAEEAGFEVLSLSSVSWEGGPVCDVGAWIRFSGEPSQEDVEATFPDAVSLSLTSSASGGRVWSVFAPSLDSETISTRLEELQVAGSASSIRYSGCNMPDES